MRKDPDILISDSELGLIVIEIKSVTIDRIVATTGHRCEFQNCYTTSSNPYQQAENQLFTLLGYCDRQEELTALAQNIIYNLRHDELKPSRDISVIVLGSGFEAMELETAVAEFLISQGIDIYIPSTPDCNILQIDKENCDPNKFWCEGGVTVSRIHRAKGNEAEMVYVVGLDKMAKDESNLQLRNQLFVALTGRRVG